jgi:hypothetical protein
MSLKVGEMFVNLGVKGAEKTVGAVTQTQKAMGELGSASLETKAAIVGAIYSLERLFAASGKMGTSLTNFAALTGISTRTLQEWQYAMIQGGGTAEEMTQNFKNIQASMARLNLMEGPPKYLALMAQLIHDPSLWAHKDDTVYMANAYVKGLQAAKNDPRAKGIMNEVARSLGLTDNFITTARRGLFSPDVFKKAPTYSDNEIKALDKANIAWANLELKIERAIGHFNALHGGDLVRDVSVIADKMLLIVNSLERIAEKIQLFKSINGLVSDTAKVIGDTANLLDKPGKATGKQLLGDTSKFLLDTSIYPILRKIFPSLPTTDTVINQTFQLPASSTPQQTADLAGKAVKDAYRQNPAQLQSH